MLEHDNIAPWCPEAPPPSLLSALWELLKHRRAFLQDRPSRRTQALVLGHLFSFACHTITQGLVALRLTDQDWSSFVAGFSVNLASTTTLAQPLADSP